MDKIDFQTLLLNILKVVTEEKDGIGITRLIKIAYLIELFYYRKFQKRLTDVEWVYYKFGPYIMNIDEYLTHDDIQFEEVEDKDITVYKLRDSVCLQALPVELRVIVSSTINKYFSMEINDLFDYIYYDTEPMINVKKRGDLLDFTTVLSNEYYKIKKYKNKNDVLKKIQNNIQKAKNE